MANLAYRRDVVFRGLGSYVAPYGSVSVMALAVGAQVTSGSSSTTATVRAGHGFIAGDKFIVWRSGAAVANSYNTVSAVASSGTSLTITAATIVAGDILVNLGPDTGIAAPNWNGSRIVTYSDPSGAGSANSNATVSSNSSGEYEYWTKATRVWELFRSANTVLDVEPDAVRLSTPAIYSVMDFGAKADGSTDDAAAIQAAITMAENDSAPATVFFPAGYYLIQSTITVALANLRGEAGSIVQAGASCTGAMVQIDTAGSMRRFERFFLNGAGNASVGIKFLLHNNFICRDVLIYDVTQYGIHCFANKAGFKARMNIDSVEVLKTSGTIAANSVGLYLQDASDAHISNSVFRDMQTGVKLDTQNNDLVNVHNWYNNALTNSMTTGFYSAGGGNRFVNCFADTVTTYGFRATTDNDSFLNCCVFNNTAYGSDNVVIAFQFDGNSPKATVIGSRIYGQDASHRIKNDVISANADYKSLVWLGNYKTNVVTEAVRDTSVKFHNSELDIEGTSGSTPVARICATGLGNASDASMVDFRASAAATPTTYARGGGIVTDFAAGSKSNFDLFGDSVPLRLRTIGAFPIQFMLNGTVKAQFDSNGMLLRSVTSGITASTTQTQGQGPLTSDVNSVSVVANANDTVTLPSAAAGMSVVIINNGANTLKIFPASGDDVGAGVNTATTLASGSNVRYTAYDATNWETI